MLHPRSRVEEIRRLSGLTKAELSRRSGISETAIRHIEGGQTKMMRADSLAAIASALRVSVEELLAEPGAPVLLQTSVRTKGDDQLQDTLTAMLTELRSLRADMHALKAGIGSRSDGAGRQPEQTDGHDGTGGHDGDGRGSEQTGDGHDGAGR